MLEWATNPALKDTLFVDGSYVGAVRKSIANTDWLIIYSGIHMGVVVRGYSSKEEAKARFRKMFEEAVKL